MKHTLFAVRFFLFLCLGSGIQILAAVKPAKPFGEHMVLQRKMPLPVWGTADPGEAVSVIFRNKTHTTKADEQGNWRVVLPAMDASTKPETFQINDIIWNDVLVGEVWFGSGQSNIYLPVEKKYFTDDKRLHEMVAKKTPHLRMIGRKGVWQTGNKENFSAQLYAFGHMLHEELYVPVGLMSFAQGGSATKPWLTYDMLLADPQVNEIIDRLAEQYPNALAAYKKLQETKTSGWRSFKEPQNPDLRVERDAGTAKEPIGFFWDKFIQDYAGYAVRGIYWDQGESMSGILYLDLHTTTRCLIAGWRKAWNRPDLPFIMVQKPSGGGLAFDPNHPDTLGSNPFNASHHPKTLRKGGGA